MQNPGESLEERLSYGGSHADAELLERAGHCAAWFEENPEQRLLWLPRLRKAKQSPMTAHLWLVVEALIDPPALVKECLESSGKSARTPFRACVLEPKRSALGA